MVSEGTGSIGDSSFSGKYKRVSFNTIDESETGGHGGNLENGGGSKGGDEGDGQGEGEGESEGEGEGAASIKGVAGTSRTDEASAHSRGLLEDAGDLHVESLEERRLVVGKSTHYIDHRRSSIYFTSDRQLPTTLHYIR